MTEERLERLEARQNNSDKRQGTIEVNMATMASDVHHIKEEIDNHLSASIKGIFLRLDEIIPLVKNNAAWVGLWKKAIVTLAITGVGLGLIALALKVLETK